MKKIVVVTATRAEYGLLKPLIAKLERSSHFTLELAVTGMHLSPEFGSTYREIEQDGFRIDNKIEILLSSDTPTAMSKAMGLALISFAEYFERSAPDAVLVLGDRYEIMAVCCAAMNARIPIFHINGGETTEGALDEAVRHSVTKMSCLHFTSTEEYRRRVIQMGEQPDRVFNVGALGVENVLHEKLLSREELAREIGRDLSGPYAVVTFHPVTLEDNTAQEQMRELLCAMDRHPEYVYVCTKANADAGGRTINRMWEEYAAARDNISLHESLGMRRYLSAVKYSEMVIGNSSSGIVEVPALGVPTVNIGDRQKGRVQTAGVINCRPDSGDILRGMALAAEADFRERIRHASNPYGTGGTSDAIMEILEKCFADREPDIRKTFYDLV